MTIAHIHWMFGVKQHLPMLAAMMFSSRGQIFHFLEFRMIVIGDAAVITVWMEISAKYIKSIFAHLICVPLFLDITGVSLP